MIIEGFNLQYDGRLGTFIALDLMGKKMLGFSGGDYPSAYDILVGLDLDYTAEQIIELEKEKVLWDKSQT